MKEKTILYPMLPPHLRREVDEWNKWQGELVLAEAVRTDPRVRLGIACQVFDNYSLSTKILDQLH